MAQAATILSEGQSLFIQDNEVFTKASATQIASERTGLLIDNGKFVINERAHLNFLVSTQFKNSFGLLKGLIDFHRPSRFSFTFDRHRFSIDVIVAADEQDALSSFLKSIHSRLLDELSFKANLKKILQFESDYKSKKDFLYHSLLNMR
jgi:hypothetical protein